MECASADFWLGLFDKVGLPLTMLAIVIWMLWVFLKWAAPRMEKWMQSYLDLQEKRTAILESSNVACLDMQRKVLAALEKLSTVIERSGKAVNSDDD